MVVLVFQQKVENKLPQERAIGGVLELALLTIIMNQTDIRQKD